MDSYHKWDVKNGLPFVLQFFSLISDGLGGVLLDQSWIPGEGVIVIKKTIL